MNATNENETAGCRIVDWEQAPPHGVCPHPWTPAFAEVPRREAIVIVMMKWGPWERSISYRWPGLAFIAIADAVCRRHAKVRRAGVVAWCSELARRILPRATPTPAGDKPPPYISPPPRLRIPTSEGMTNLGAGVVAWCS